MPVACCAGADIVVSDDWESLETCHWDKDTVYVWRTKKEGFFIHSEELESILPHVVRLNIILTDVETFAEADFSLYKAALGKIALLIKSCYEKKVTPQLNLLTDRLMLDGMNNCNAGWESITLAPDGKYYACPAFYLSDDACCIGSIEEGLGIKNPQLYRLDHAPLCRNCDAYQCKRCIWLNRKTTLEMNTPSHEQCVAAHLERNISCDLLQEIRKIGNFFPDREIKEINYLDPFDVRKQF